MYTQGIVQQIFTWISFGTLGVILVMRIIRGVAFSFKKDISIFYMFLYLCALELAPLVLLYRWLEGVL
jgi:magnesium-transporting ATPase (P-type)